MSDKVLSQFKPDEEVAEKVVTRVFKVAIIGTGWIAEAYVKPIKDLPNVELVALADLIPGKAEKFAKKNGLDADKLRFYPSHKELIDNEKPDFILSTVPTFLHKEIAVYALSHGVHVFSEKPMALSVEDCEEMIKAAKDNDRKLMIGQCLRFDPAFSKLKEYGVNAIRGPRFMPKVLSNYINKKEG